jgi:serine/threonine protein kinase
MSFESASTNQKLFQAEIQETGYEFLHVIGSGLSGSVFKVKSKKYNIDFAAKAYKKHSDKVSAGTKEEFECLCTLDHPNIIVPYQAFETKSFFVIVLEFCETSLRDKIKQKGTFSEQEFIPIARDLINALDYCHSQNILHCDLKATNILIDKYQRIKLCDFGLAKLMKSCDKSPNEIRETFNYMAPELFSPNSCNSVKSDIWSLGLVFYQCLTGSVPWNQYAGEIKEIMIMNHPFDFSCLDLSKKVETLLKRMLHRSPYERCPLSELKLIASQAIPRQKTFSTIPRLDHTISFRNWKLKAKPISSRRRLNRKTTM